MWGDQALSISFPRNLALFFQTFFFFRCLLKITWGFEKKGRGFFASSYSVIQRVFPIKVFTVPYCIYISLSGIPFFLFLSSQVVGFIQFSCGYQHGYIDLKYVWRTKRLGSLTNHSKAPSWYCLIKIFFSCVKECLRPSAGKAIEGDKRAGV